MFNQFSNLKLIQTALQNVVMDLQSGTQVMDSTGHNLDEVLEQCLLLKQDLANASQIVASSSLKIRRYPVRRRPTGLAPDLPTESPPQTNKKKVRNGDKSKKRGRHGPGPKLDTKEGQTSSQVKIKPRQTRVDPVVEEDTKEDIVIESEAEGWSSGIDVPGVSLEQMIAAFKTWNRSPESSQITPKSPSIQPWMSEVLPGPSNESEREVSSLLVSSKVPRMDLESAEMRSEDLMMTDEAQKDSSNLEECTLSTGYTLQSFQLLQRNQESEKIQPEIPCFTPMIQPESYTSPSSLRGFIPTWQASSKVVKKSKDLDLLIPRKMNLTEPMVERLKPDQVKSGINVKDFLARMDTTRTGNHPLMIPSSFDRHNLTNNINHLFLHLLTRQPLPELSRFRVQDLKGFVSGDSLDRGGGGSTDEDRLKTLSRQLETLYDPKEKNELSELLSTMDC